MAWRTKQRSSRTLLLLPRHYADAVRITYHLLVSSFATHIYLLLLSMRTEFIRTANFIIYLSSDILLFHTLVLFNSFPFSISSVIHLIHHWPINILDNEDEWGGNYNTVRWHEQVLSLSRSRAVCISIRFIIFRAKASSSLPLPFPANHFIYVNWIG